MEDAAGNQLAEVDEKRHYRSFEEQIPIAVPVEGCVYLLFHTQNQFLEDGRSVTVCSESERNAHFLLHRVLKLKSVVEERFVVTAGVKHDGNYMRCKCSKILKRIHLQRHLFLILRMRAQCRSLRPNQSLLLPMRVRLYSPSPPQEKWQLHIREFWESICSPFRTEHRMDNELPLCYDTSVCEWNWIDSLWTHDFLPSHYTPLTKNRTLHKRRTSTTI